MAQNGKTSGEKGQLKVELDLDDAPFLDDEPEEDTEASAGADEPAAASSEPEIIAVPAPAPDNKKKKLIMAGAGGLIIVILAVVVNVFLFSGDTPPPPPPEPPKEDQAKTPPPPPPVQEYMMQWEPFWVELKDTEGASRFLTIKFSIPTTNPIVFAEMNGKKLILRDALFYYLRNQPIISLSDEAKATELKSELLTTINEHLGSGKVNDILIQDYLLK